MSSQDRCKKDRQRNDREAVCKAGERCGATAVWLEMEKTGTVQSDRDS